MQRLLLALASTLSLAAGLQAAEIIPDPVNPYDYTSGLDPLPNHGFGVLKMSDFGIKLTDGFYGDMTPGVSLGNADPSNWVEFGGSAEVTFHFTETTNVQNILLSMANWNPAAIYLPDLVKVNGNVVTYSGTFPGMDRAFISLDGNWTGTDLVVRLQDTGNRYMFMDEISLYGTPGEGLQSIPEPSTYALLAGLGVLGLAAVRRRRK